MVWFWYFLIYSFLGFLVEVVYARSVGAAKRDRKCRLLLPICPVYGLGALAVLALPAAVRAHPLLLLPAAGAACTAVEYLTSIFYEKVFRVAFWDYSHLPCRRSISSTRPRPGWRPSCRPGPSPPPPWCWGRTPCSPPWCCGGRGTRTACAGMLASPAAGPPEGAAQARRRSLRASSIFFCGT